MDVTRKVRFFRQHSLETCGISCILMIMDYFRKVQYPTARQEAALYRLYQCRAFKGVQAASAAECLAKGGLKVTVAHACPRMLENRDGYFPEDMFQAMRAEYIETLERAIGMGVDVETGAALTPEWYREQLSAGQLVMAQCIVPGDADGMHDRVLHWVLLYGCDGGVFRACDPLSHKIELTPEELEHYTDTPIGRIAVTAQA